MKNLRLQSIPQTLLWFHTEGVELPVNKPRGRRMRIVWQLPTKSFVDSVLHSHFYAGAYVYGQRQTETSVVDGRLVKRHGRVRSPKECRVFIPDHHRPPVSA